jgi:hypothetical protein
MWPPLYHGVLGLFLLVGWPPQSGALLLVGAAARRMMVVGDENGQGAFVAEVAGRHPEPVATVLRASKVIASDGWSGQQFAVRFDSSPALLQELEDLHVEYVVVDWSLDATNHELSQSVRDLTDQHADRVSRVYSAAGARPISVYQLQHQSPGAAKSPQMAIFTPLGQWQR